MEVYTSFCNFIIFHKRPKMHRKLPTKYSRKRLFHLLILLLMAPSPLLSISRSLPSSLRSIRSLYTLSSSPFCPKHLQKSYPCPLWSSSFSFCLSHKTLRRSTPLISPVCKSSCCFSSMATESPVLSDVEALESNPLLQDFVFPPFDVVEPKHVRPGIRGLLKKLVYCLSLS